MNYRHAYHAGNFADVLKHAILARVLTYMKLKPQPFRVIDTHAGAGRYDLSGTEAGRTGEWRDGIGRIVSADLSDDVSRLLAPYLDTVRALNAEDALRYYPGSPLIARHLMREGDYLIANELHPEDGLLLKSEFEKDKSVKVLDLDAWVAVKSLLPPKERRGLVLIDPPFEDRNEFSYLTEALKAALARFANGVYLIWYPVKNVDEADQFVGAVSAMGLKYLDARIAISAPFPGLGLTEAGVLVVNPPYTLRGELDTLLPVLSDVLAEADTASYRLVGCA